MRNIFCVLLLISVSLCDTLYVDSVSGVDSGSCEKRENPCRSFAYAQTLFQVRTVVEILDFSTSEEHVIVVSKSVTVTAPAFVFRGFPIFSFVNTGINCSFVDCSFRDYSSRAIFQTDNFIVIGDLLLENVEISHFSQDEKEEGIGIVSVAVNKLVLDNVTCNECKGTLCVIKEAKDVVVKDGNFTNLDSVVELFQPLDRFPKMSTWINVHGNKFFNPVYVISTSEYAYLSSIVVNYTDNIVETTKKSSIIAITIMASGEDAVDFSIADSTFDCSFDDCSIRLMHIIDDNFEGSTELNVFISNIRIGKSYELKLPDAVEVSIIDSFFNQGRIDADQSSFTNSREYKKTNFHVDNCTFLNTQIRVYVASNFTMLSSSVHNDSSVFIASANIIYIDGCSFRYNTYFNNLIDVDYFDFFVVKNCEFIGNQAHTHWDAQIFMLTFINQPQSFYIQNCVFQDNWATAISVRSYFSVFYSMQLRTSVSMQNVTFVDSFSEKGQMRFSGMMKVEAENIACESNLAEYGSCVYFSGFVSFHVTNSPDWTGNHAIIAGGTLFKELYQPLFFHNNDFNSTAGVYGEIEASSIYRIELLYVLTEEGRYFDNSSETIFVFPGEKFTVVLSGSDYNNEMVKEDTESNFYFKSKGEDVNITILHPQVKMESAESGRIVFSDFRVTGSGGSNFLLSFYSDNFFGDGDVPVQLNFNLTLCPKYYELYQETRECVKCEKDYYKNVVDDEYVCRKCPKKGAECDHGKISALNGYYLFFEERKKDNPYLYTCVENVCRNDSCTKEREGVLCANCKKGYSKVGPECVKCSASVKSYSLFFIDFFVLFVVFIIGTHLLANTISLTLSTKNLIFFSQTLVLVGVNYSSNWYVVIDRVGYFVKFMFDFGWFDIFRFSLCPFPIPETWNLFINSFIKVVTFLFFVCLLLIVTTIRKCCCSCKKKGEKLDVSINSNLGKPLLQNNVVGKASAIKTVMKSLFGHDSYFRTTLYMLDLVYISLLEDTFNFLTCPRLGSRRKILSMTKYNCYTNEYFLWFAYYFVIIIILLLIPVCILIFLVRNIANFHQHTFRERFGEWYEQYKVFWFEFVQFLMKFLIVFLLFFVNTFIQNADFSFILFSMLFFIYILVFMIFQPYKSGYENFSRIVALVILFAVSILKISSFESYVVEDTIIIVSFISLFWFLFSVLVNNNIFSFVLKYLKKTISSKLPVKHVKPSLEIEEDDKENGEVSQLKDKLINLKKIVEKLEKENSEKTELVTRLENKVSGLSAKNEELQKSNMEFAKQLEATSQTLNDKITELMTKMSIIEEDRKKKTGEVENLVKKIKENEIVFQNKVQSKTNELSKKDEEISTIRTTIERLERENKELAEQQVESKKEENSNK